VIERFGFVGSSLYNLAALYAAQDRFAVGVLGPQRVFAGGEAALVERLGFGVAALDAIQQGQVIERGAN
jgi:hypothetical protein